MVWIASLSQFWMKWDDSMIGQEDEKATYRADVEAALANNDLAELKIKKKSKRWRAGIPCRPPLLLMETER